MEESKKSFIKDICNSLKSQMSSEVWNEFSSTQNSAKVAFLVRKTEVLELIQSQIEAELTKCQSKGPDSDKDTSGINDILKGCDFSKSKAKSLLFKGAGNEAFGQGDNSRALDFYSQAIAFMDPTETTDLSILYANRSAALFHLGHFALAQADIDSALALPYPPELHYKLYERSGRCYAKTGQNPQAARRFQQAIKSLAIPLVNLDSDKKKSTIVALEKLLKTTSGNGFAFICGESGSSEKEVLLPIISGGRGKYLRNASAKLSLMRSEAEGRYVVANENIGPGEIIVVEKAFVSTLTPEAYHYQCFQCFRMLLAPVPCYRCALVSFCSDKCRNLAWTSHHQYECDILGIVRLAGVSITCLMALRVLTQSSYSEVMTWKSEPADTDELEALDEKLTKSGTWRDFRFQFKDDYKPDHISSVFKLVTHANSSRRTPEDYFQRVVMALFLYTVLQRTKYFDNPPGGGLGVKAIKNRGGGVTDNEDKGSLPGNGSFDERESSDAGESGTKSTVNHQKVEQRPTEPIIIQVGSILLRMLQTLQFNAHEIAAWDSKVSKSCFIGGGLFPTLAFFNHSCNPAIVRYFINDTVVVRTVRTIQRGEPVTENYGPIFTQSGRSERQEFLECRYWFTCSCVACLDNWPLFTNLSRENLSFRCRNCRAYLCGNTTESFNLLLRCGRCLKPTNMLQSLKSLEKSEGKFNQAMEFLEQGKGETAQGILIENITLFDAILLPPFADYHWCQEGLRKCFLPLGNKCDSSKIKENSNGGVKSSRSAGTIVG